MEGLCRLGEQGGAAALPVSGKEYECDSRGRASKLRKQGGPLKLRQAIPIAALVGIVTGTLACLVYWPAILLPLGYLTTLASASSYFVLKILTVRGTLRRTCRRNDAYALGDGLSEP